jgi:hypothetical protein
MNACTMDSVNAAMVEVERKRACIKYEIYCEHIVVQGSLSYESDGG